MSPDYTAVPYPGRSVAVQGNVFEWILAEAGRQREEQLFQRDQRRIDNVHAKALVENLLRKPVI